MKKIKIAAFVIGAIVIVIGLTFANSIIGNPVSKMLSQKKVEKYVEGKYGDLNLDLKKTFYNFKFGEYVTVAYSRDSKDTEFTIYTDDFGNVEGDDYENAVLNRYSTYTRLSSELYDKAQDLIVDRMNYDFEYAYIGFVDNAEEEEYSNNLKLDMDLDIYNPPIPLNASIGVFSEEVTWDKIADAALNLKTEMEGQNIPISEYSILLIPMSNKSENGDEAVSWENSLGLSAFPAELMESENLPVVMEEFENKQNEELEKIKEEELKAAQK